MVELKTHAAQLGWNTCNPSLLLGFVFCWHIYFKCPPFFISSARLAHTPMNHTHEHTHVSCRDYSHSFHHTTLLFPPCCKPCKLLCCVLHGFTHMLCQFELFFLCLSVTVMGGFASGHSKLTVIPTRTPLILSSTGLCVCVCVRVRVYVCMCECVCVCMYSIIHGPLLGICAIYLL